MQNYGRDSRGYKYIYLITALICVFCVALVIALVVGGTYIAPASESESVDSAETSEQAAVSQTSSEAVTSETSRTAIGDMNFVAINYQNTEMSKGSLIIVGKDDKSYEPDSTLLKKLNTYMGSNSKYGLRDYSICMYEETAKNLDKMLVDFYAAVTTNKLGVAGGAEEGSTYPELSTGYSALFTLYGKDPDSHVIGSDKYSWLINNAYKYGFTVRYPADKAEQTGVAGGNPAIYRYVGIPHTEYMRDYNMCLEEYVQYLKQFSSANPLIIDSKIDGNKYYVYYQKADVGETTGLLVPDATEYSYSISGNKSDGFIITVT